MMKVVGFPCQFVEWVMACITSVSYSILINGFPSPSFKAKKGLRKGDPMSPYLFALGMEYWSRNLQSLINHRGFGFHPKCKRVGLVSSLFADDFLF